MRWPVLPHAIRLWESILITIIIFIRIFIALKYDKATNEPVIRKIQRISKPGLRKYSSYDSMPRVLNGLGISIISTSKGLMTGKQANRENVGGEILCYIY